MSMSNPNDKGRCEARAIKSLYTALRAPPVVIEHLVVALDEVTGVPPLSSIERIEQALKLLDDVRVNAMAALVALATIAEDYGVKR